MAMFIAAPVLVVTHNRGRLKDWRQAAERYGMIVVKASKLPVFLRLTARSGPVEIRIKEEKNDVRVAATVEGPPELSQVVIRREILNLPGTREIEIGDETFDWKFLVRGPLPFVCALLNAPVRSMLREADALNELSISNGKLRIEVPESKLDRALGLFRDLGRRFAETQDVPRLLLENVRQDPVPEVRLLNLTVLIREYPGDPSTEEALRIASHDASPQVRLKAALELGAEGYDGLLSLAERLEDDAVSARAVAALGSAQPLDFLQSVLAGAQEKQMPGTARACLEALGGLGRAAIETLAEVMARDSSELAVTAAQGLGATGDPAAEPPLLAALARDNPALQAAAAEALGRVGSVDSVLPLQEAAERSGALRKAARQAIADIQARLEGAVPGQLSLATTEAGQLSLATEAGQLSLAPHQAGQLSLPPERARAR